MRTSYGTGRYQASETDILARKVRFFSTGQRGCLLFPGSTNTTAVTLTTPSVVAVMRAIAGAGLSVFTAEYGSPTGWGNDTAVTRAETARTYQQTQHGVLTDKVVLCGYSMGSVAALRYAMAHPTRVAAIVLLTPIPDVQAQYDGNVGGFQAAIGAAYGGRPSNAQNPASNPSSFTSFPIRMWYSTDDTIAPPAPTFAFAAATGAALSSLGAVGHTFTNLDLGAVASFVEEHS